MTALFQLLLLVATSASAQSAFVRINQLGYEAGVDSRAYLMSRAPEKGASFRVTDEAGVAVHSGSIVSKLGVWGKFQVYALDFKVVDPGTYTIEVDGSFSATSPSFAVAPPDELYKRGIRNALSFYQNERDGANFIRTPLRVAPGHLNDKHVAVFKAPQFDSDDLILGELQPTGEFIDASGGWWDAGDYLKFVQTHSYTVALMLVGVRDFPQQMGAQAGSSNFTQEARFGLEWLRKMWNDETQTLYYQVGIGTGFEDDPDILSDHDLWRLPQADDKLDKNDPTLRFLRHRPAFAAGPAGSKISPNLAGRLAADFAECFQVFRVSQPGFANDCLMVAEHIFDLANTSPKGDLLTVGPFDFYGETEWRDDMELGASQLSLALMSAGGRLPSTLPHTDPRFYLRRAAHWAHAYIAGPNDASDTLNLYDVSGLAHFELIRAMKTAGHPKDLEVSQADLVRDLRLQLQHAMAQAISDPFGFGYPWDTYDTATHGAGLSVVAREYALLTHSEIADQFSRRWASNILGANAWGSSFIVGDGEVFPDCMQHQVANIVGSLDGKQPRLNGALVEGPNSFTATGLLDGMRKCPAGGGNVFRQFDGNGAVYRDDEQSYSTVEPAIDLTAGSFLMFAWRIAGSPADFAVQEESATPDIAFVPAASPSWPIRRNRARHQRKVSNARSPQANLN